MTKAEKLLFDAHGDKEYLPITVSMHPGWIVAADTKIQGLQGFTKLAAELAYGKDSKPLTENRVSRST